MAEELHLVAVNEGRYGWSLSSPQMPGFVFGRPTLTELFADLDDALEFAGAPDLPRMLHQERRFETPEDGEYLVRVAQDEHRDARATAAWRLDAVMEVEEQRRHLLARDRLLTGEVLLIAALAGDELGWLFDQMGKDEVAQIVVAVADEMLFVTQIGTRNEDPDALTLADFDLSLDSTVSDLMRVIESNPRARVLLDSCG